MLTSTEKLIQVKKEDLQHQLSQLFYGKGHSVPSERIFHSRMERSGREELADGLMTPNLCGQLSRKLFEENRKANHFLEATYKQHQQLQHKHKRWAGSTLIRCCLWGKQGRVTLGPHLENLFLENMN